MSMSGWRVTPATQPLAGKFRIPSDKSITHRGVMLGGLAKGTTRIEQPLLGKDTRSTMQAMVAFGAQVTEGTGWMEITGEGALHNPDHTIDCGNAGTLIRLLAGLVCGRNVSCQLAGDASLCQRPMHRITQPLQKMGAHIQAEEDGTPPLAIKAVSSLRSIEYELPQASAQVKSAILLAGLAASDGACVVEPLSCRDHTELMLPLFGAKIKRVGTHINVAACPTLQAAYVTVPADISSAAFFLVAASIVPGSDLLLEEVCVNPTRTGIIDILKRMGASIEIIDRRQLGNELVADLRIRHAQLHGIKLRAPDVPAAIDEFPAIFVAASVASGQFSLRGAAELRAKECDRLAAMATALRELGVQVTEHPDGMDIKGGHLHGGAVESRGDHRIAMAMAVAALQADSTVTVNDVTNVATSFPGFAQLAQSVNWQVVDTTS